MNKFTKTLVLLTIAVFILACGGTAPREKLQLYPTPTGNPTQTPVIVIWTGTPAATYTPIVVLVTQTPYIAFLCVSAVEAVYLRPAPNLENRPISAELNGAQVRDLGGRNNGWAFVAVDGKQGWIKSDYLGGCNG